MKNEKRSKAILLRTEKRMSFSEISEELGVAKGTLSYWLKKYPLTKEEVKKKASENLAKYNREKKKYPGQDRGTESKYHKMIKENELENKQKGRIAESAIFFRASLLNIPFYKAIMDGDKIDCLVHDQKKDLFKKVQIRWAGQWGSKGSPKLRLTCTEGRYKYRRYRDDEFDYLIGYNLYTDTAYVYTQNDLKKYKKAISLRPEHAEAWHKLFKE